jgi:hypothetical protein
VEWFQGNGPLTDVISVHWKRRELWDGTGGFGHGLEVFSGSMVSAGGLVRFVLRKKRSEHFQL